MKRSDPTSPVYLSWCLIARNCASTIETTLRSIRERTPNAEIVVVDTMSSDNGATWAIAEKYADVLVEYTGPKGTWTREMPWFDDAAAARNKAYELASGHWKAWIDADDELVKPSEVKRLLQVNGMWMPDKDNSGKGTSQVPMTLEEALHAVEEKNPAIDCIWAPYLYQHEEDGKAIVWQQRERITKNHDRWTWRGAAHEIRVQVNSDYRPPLANFNTLLFVHRKVFNHEAELYALKRHFDVLTSKLQAEGKLSTQEYLYLVNYSIFLCPERRSQFIQGAIDASFTPVERMRARIAEGNFLSENGFYLDAMEAFASATAVVRNLPDPWIAGAHAFLKAEQWLKAAEWFGYASACQMGAIETEVSPRDQMVTTKMRAADALISGARQLKQGGDWPRARAAYEQAETLAAEAAIHPAAANDSQSAGAIAHLAHNEAEGIKLMAKLEETFDYLVRNDETKKAADLLSIVPHNMVDHPFALKLEKFAEKIHTHFTDQKSYHAFYENQEAVGAIPSDEQRLLDGKVDARVTFLIDQLKTWRPNARVAEVGCFDGNIGLPVLLELHNVQYTGIEAQASAIARFKERAGRASVANRLHLVHGLDGAGDGYDAVVFFEVIEHVPDPVATIKQLLARLKPDGRLFMSTPWGSFDRGYPFNMDVRDPRGHVRAMMPRDVHAVVQEAGGRVIEQGGTPGLAGFSATMHMAIERVEEHRPLLRAKPLTFYVPTALEDWNASSVEKGGIGASEETIVYLARAIANERRTEVYGPLPDNGSVLGEETRAGVAYWPREQLRKVLKNSTVVVSRSPGSWKNVEGCEDRVLWLQDTYYPDLTPEVAERYRKVVVLTNWHKQLIHELHGVPLEKMAVINNFLLKEHYPVPFNDVERKPHHFVYASSPDRGLIPLLRMWPKILKQLPDATLSIFYGWGGCMKLGLGDPTWVARYKAVRTEYLTLCRQPGIIERGRVNHAEIAKEMRSAAAYLYPGDPRTGIAFAETGCLNAIKARASGCVMVCTPYAGLLESAMCDETQYVEVRGLKEAEYEEKFVEAVLTAVAFDDAERLQMAHIAVENHSLDAMLPAWRRVLGGED